LGDLGVTYRVHLWLDGKCDVDFLLAIIQLFLLALTAVALLSKICPLQKLGEGWAKFSQCIIEFDLGPNM